MQVKLNEQELVQLIQLVTSDMVAETHKQAPGTDFTASLAPLAKKLHDARNKMIGK